MELLRRGTVASFAHPDATLLVEMARGDLRAQAATELRMHCLVCDECARQLRALVGLRDVHGLTVPPEARGALLGLEAAAIGH